ncbi:MAG: tetratricopeptide repeat protein [Desulfobacterales bacterium]
MNKNDKKKEMFAHAMSCLMKDNIGTSIELLNKILDSDPTDKLVLLARGSAYLKSGKAENAIGDFSRAIEVDSGYAKAYHQRGLAQELAGDNDAALKDFDKAIEIDSEYGAAYFSRATLLTKMGQEDSATEDMKMVAHLTNVNLESFANENNVWRSRHMQMETMLETDLNR